MTSIPFTTFKTCCFVFFTSLFLIFQNSAQLYAQDNYVLGVGIYDVTGQIAQSNYFGYADPFFRNSGMRDRQYARAFIIEEPNGKPVVFVCIDKGATFQSVNLAVLKKLKARYGSLYQDENVIISATHTHVAAGGQSHFSLYELSSGGYWKTNFDNLVNGIYGAIVRAHNSKAPGRIYINRGELTNASVNRSLVAYNNNADASGFSSIDEEMTVLRLEQGNKEVGMISWFAVHPTSLSNSYAHNSGDNKGYAALKFERAKGSSYKASGAFVAAFANTNAGDLSPNLNLPPSNRPNENATGPGRDEEESTAIIGSRQYEKAMQLYTSATEQLMGSVSVVSRYSDFSNIDVASKFTDGQPQNTCKAALGISFTAGAEDGRSGLGIKEGITKNPDFGASIDRCHAQKPIAPLFFLGSNDADPATPKILPTTLMKIGQLGILAVPAEFTVMAGRRVRSTIAALPNTGITTTILAGYSDAYSGYVTTAEEYAMQQYEGASTHFGPWTLAAYQQEFERLAIELVSPNTDPWPNPEPAIPNKSAPSIDVTAPILFDSTPFFKSFGAIADDVSAAYAKGGRAQVTFWGAHPNNDLRVNGTYLQVQRKNGTGWKTVYTDRDTNTKLTWKRDRIANSKITIGWNIPEDAVTGVYQIRHFGKYKDFFTGSLRPYSGTSSTFVVGDDTNFQNKELKTTRSDLIADNIRVYPNPSQGTLFLEVTNNLEGQYEITDVLGKIIKKGGLKSDGVFPIQLKASAGMYFLNVYDKNGGRHSYSIMKN